MSRLTIFWISMLPVLILFGIGVWANISIWFQGQVNSLHGPVTRRKFWGVLGFVISTVFSSRFSLVLKALILDGLLHRRLWATDKLRWLAHFCLLIGFSFLFALSTFTGFFEEILHFMLHIEHPFVLSVINKDTPVMALLNEVFGLVIAAGLILVIIRRYLQRPAQLRTEAVDTATIIFIALIMLTSYPTEAFRYLMENTAPTSGWWGFVGYALALLLRPLAWPWDKVHFWSFFIHVWSCQLFLLYLPFSKFFHVAVSPLVATVNSVLRSAEA